MFGFIIAIGFIGFFVLGALLGFYFDHEILGMVCLFIAFALFMGGLYITSNDQSEKCTCEETVQVETCEDCGGILK